MPERPLLLIHANLLTDHPGGPDALLLQGGRIVRIDGTEALLRDASDARVLDAGGRTVSAGFHDAHLHFLQLGLEAARPSLRAAPSLAAALEIVRDALSSSPTDSLLIAEHWDETAWPERRWPTRDELDAIAPLRPVLLRRIDAHTAVANGAAIRLLESRGDLSGVDAPTGVCREGVIRRLDDLFPPSDVQLREAVRAAEARCLALGITTASEFVYPPMVRMYERARTGRERVRVFAHRVVSSPDEVGAFPALPDVTGLRGLGIKIFTDGAIGGRTAALFEPYRDRPGETGVLLFDDRTLAAMIRAAHDRGWSAAVHAIGDRAIAQVLDAFAQTADDENASIGHRIEHFELPRERDLDRLRETGVRPCVQPNFVGEWAGPGGLYETALGAERVRHMNPIRTLLRRDARPFFGSDGMPASPRYGLWSAVHHPVEPERLDVRDAHRLYTECAADATDPSRRSGRIDVGADADLVVLPGTLSEWVDGRRDEVDVTIVAGGVAHERVPLERASSS